MIRCFSTSSRLLRRSIPRISRLQSLQQTSIRNADVLSTITSGKEDPSASWFIDTSFNKITTTPLKETPTTNTTNSDEMLDDRGALRLEYVVKYLINEMKAQNVTVINVRDKCTWTEFMVICTGVSKTHVRQITEGFYVMAKKSIRVKSIENEEEEGVNDCLPIEARKVKVEGRSDPNWKLVDLGNIIVHFFTEDARKEYQLEELWK